MQPLVRLHKLEPHLGRTIGPKLLIAIADIGRPEQWSSRQLEALRHCQSALSLSDDELETFDTYFERTIADVIKEFPSALKLGANDLLEIAHLQAAFADNDASDAAYADAIRNLGRCYGTDLSIEEIILRIKAMRRKFR